MSTHAPSSTKFPKASSSPHYTTLSGAHLSQPHLPKRPSSSSNDTSSIDLNMSFKRLLSRPADPSSPSPSSSSILSNSTREPLTRPRAGFGSSLSDSEGLTSPRRRHLADNFYQDLPRRFDSGPSAVDKPIRVDSPQLDHKARNHPSSVTSNNSPFSSNPSLTQVNPQSTWSTPGSSRSPSFSGVQLSVGKPSTTHRSRGRSRSPQPPTTSPVASQRAEKEPKQRNVLRRKTSSSSFLRSRSQATSPTPSPVVHGKRINPTLATTTTTTITTSKMNDDNEKLTPAGAVARAYKLQEQRRSELTSISTTSSLTPTPSPLTSTRPNHLLEAHSDLLNKVYGGAKQGDGKVEDDDSDDGTGGAYYTVLGSTTGKVVAVGSPEDSYTSTSVAGPSSSFFPEPPTPSRKALNRKRSLGLGLMGGSSGSGANKGNPLRIRVSLDEIGRAKSTPATAVATPRVESPCFSFDKHEKDKNSSGSGGKLWKLMKRLSTNGLKDKYGAGEERSREKEEAPPVPKLPKLESKSETPTPEMMRSDSQGTLPRIGDNDRGRYFRSVSESGHGSVGMSEIEDARRKIGSSKTPIADSHPPASSYGRKPAPNITPLDLSLANASNTIKPRPSTVSVGPTTPKNHGSTTKAQRPSTIGMASKEEHRSARTSSSKSRRSSSRSRPSTTDGHNHTHSGTPKAPVFSRSQSQIASRPSTSTTSVSTSGATSAGRPSTGQTSLESLPSMPMGWGEEESKVFKTLGFVGRHILPPSEIAKRMETDAVGSIGDGYKSEPETTRKLSESSMRMRSGKDGLPVPPRRKRSLRRGALTAADTDDESHRDLDEGNGRGSPLLPSFSTVGAINTFGPRASRPATAPSDESGSVSKPFASDGSPTKSIKRRPSLKLMLLSSKRSIDEENLRRPATATFASSSTLPVSDSQTRSPPERPSRSPARPPPPSKKTEQQKDTKLSRSGSRKMLKHRPRSSSLNFLTFDPIVHEHRKPTRSASSGESVQTNGRSQQLSEDEKTARWEELLAKSDKAGGTLHLEVDPTGFGKLESEWY